MTFVVIGEALIDIAATHDSGANTASVCHEYVGGSPANVAIGLSRLGNEVSFATHIGADARGLRIDSHLKENGVCLIAGSGNAQETSTATVTRNKKGTESYQFDIKWDLSPELVVPQGHVHVGSIGALLEPGASAVVRVVEAAREKSTVSYDPNIRPAIVGNRAEVLAKVGKFVGLSDVVKASAEDIAWLYPGVAPQSVLAKWLKLGPQLCVLTNGVAGSTGVTKQGSFTVKAVRVEVADSIGAGDTFMAALIDGLACAGLLGKAQSRKKLASVSLEMIMPIIRRAGLAASISCERAGANPPTRAELDAVNEPE